MEIQNGRKLVNQQSYRVLRIASPDLSLTNYKKGGGTLNKNHKCSSQSFQEILEKETKKQQKTKEEIGEFDPSRPV